MEKGLIQIKLLGTSFTIQADEDRDYLERLVAYLESKIGEMEKSVSVKDPLRVSLITALVLTDELFKEREKKTDTSSTEEDEEVSRLTTQIIETLDRSLKDLPE